MSSSSGPLLSLCLALLLPLLSQAQVFYPCVQRLGFFAGNGERSITNTHVDQSFIAVSSGYIDNRTPRTHSLSTTT